MSRPETLVVLLTALACGLYALSLVAVCRGGRRLGLGFAAAAWLANAALVAANWFFCGQPPLGNMHHVLVFLSLCFLPLYAMLCRRHSLGWVLPHFVFASLFPLLGSFFIERDLVWRRVPALQSPWFTPHVVSYMVSYALAAVAFVLTLTALWREWSCHGTLPRLRRLSAAVCGEAVLAKPEATAAHVILRLAFPFMTFGMLSGALWAEEAWGVYWSWDPKETWSLTTWTLYVVFFHCRLTPRFRRWAVLAQLAAFVALLVTFLVVNLLPKLGSLLHSYA